MGDETTLLPRWSAEARTSIIPSVPQEAPRRARRPWWESPAACTLIGSALGGVLLALVLAAGVLR